jgi:hypothetical protein
VSANEKKLASNQPWSSLSPFYLPICTLGASFHAKPIPNPTCLLIRAEKISYLAMFSTWNFREFFLRNQEVKADRVVWNLAATGSAGFHPRCFKCPNPTLTIGRREVVRALHWPVELGPTEEQRPGEPYRRTSLEVKFGTNNGLARIDAAPRERYQLKTSPS